MRRNIASQLVVSLLCLAWSLTSRADVVVIVHPDNPLQTMTPREVSDLYLGRTRVFVNRDRKSQLSAEIYEQPMDSSLRESFFRALNGMDIKQLNAYWARLRFSGEVLPPETLPDCHAVVEAVKRNRHGIGYVNAADASGPVKVVLRLKE